MTRLAFLALALSLSLPASAQYAVIVNACGSKPLTPGTTAQATIDIPGRLCTRSSTSTFAAEAEAAPAEEAEPVHRHRMRRH
jgi:hypothetical protein